MNTDEHTQTLEWITVDQAFLLCLEADLTRTKKTIRSWCRLEHVQSQKQTTPTGERWMIEKASLLIKIKAEKEMQRQFAQVPPGSHTQEPLLDNTNQPSKKSEDPNAVQTRSNPSDPVQTRTNPFEPVRTDGEDGSEVHDLRAKLQSLEIDKAVRDQHITFLNKQNSEGRENLLSQSRYIGHLETKLVALGGVPDQTFLSAPLPQSNEETPNPDQARLSVD